MGSPNQPGSPDDIQARIGEGRRARASIGALSAGLDSAKAFKRLQTAGVTAAWQVPLFLPTRFLDARTRSEEHTSELQSLMRISYAVFCLKKKKKNTKKLNKMIYINTTQSIKHI